MYYVTFALSLSHMFMNCIEHLMINLSIGHLYSENVVAMAWVEKTCVNGWLYSSSASGIMYQSL